MAAVPDIEGFSPTQLRESTVMVSRDQYRAMVDLMAVLGHAYRGGDLPEALRAAYEKMARVFASG